MRPLSPEEVEQAKKILRPLRWAPLVVLVVAVLFVGFFFRGPVRDDWRPLLIPVVFFGIGFWGAWRRKAQIEADLRGGFAETLQGAIEKLWHSKQEANIRVDGMNLRVERDIYRSLKKGQHVTVDYLPRSRIALKVAPRA